ncbi:hypothetical protein [Bacillus sp. FSL R7-0685]|uniref:hypothetical protein n=1 Tax=Bacillus sp. FSL R7-0685 TaxID=2921589 RepID=UPI0030F95854
MKTIKQFLIDYSREVISGEIVACEKHIWTCERCPLFYREFVDKKSLQNLEGFPVL